MGNDDQARRVIVAIRCTPLERDTIKAAAEAAGMTASDFIRAALMRELDRADLPETVVGSRE